MKKIVLFGDSLMAGLYYGELSTLLDDYLADSLAEQEVADFEIKNYGRRGESTIEGLARIDEVVAEDADFVVVLFGDNDAIKGKTDLEGYVENIQTILSYFDPKKTILLTPTYVNTKIRQNADNNVLEVYAKNAETAALAAGVASVNLYHEMTRLRYPDDLVQHFDGLHPSKIGYHYIASLIAHQIADKVASKDGAYE